LKNLALSSILILLLSGCSISLFNNFQPSELTLTGDKNPDSWFRKDAGRYLFQSTIDIYKNNYTGLLFVKPVGENYRILFITEMGIKIFDIEFFRDNDFKVHYCVEELNKKTIINTLGNDLYLMLFNIAEEGKLMREKKEGTLIIKSKDSFGTRYCTLDEQTNKVEELIKTGTFLNKVNIKFSGKAEPDSILISHYNFKLKIQLTRLHELSTEIP